MIVVDEPRRRMVEEQLKARGLSDPRLLAAFLKVPRHLFVPPEFQSQAYADQPVPIGSGQTISQPYMVALMTHHLQLQGHERVLEIGSGSGYQTAILAELVLEVFSVERVPDLLISAQRRLVELGYWNAHLKTSNGTLGWPEAAPYDAIIVTAAAPEVPPPLLEQLAERGRMVLPVGTHDRQILVHLQKHGREVVRQELASCMFVPLLGAYGWPAT